MARKKKYDWEDSGVPESSLAEQVRDARRARSKRKEKCCKENPRCLSCQVVLQRLEKQGAFKLDDQGLENALRKARKW